MSDELYPSLLSSPDLVSREADVHSTWSLPLGPSINQRNTHVFYQKRFFRCFVLEYSSKETRATGYGPKTIGQKGTGESKIGVGSGGGEGDETNQPTPATGTGI